MKFATITTTRGDRPQFLEFCKHQLSRMNTKPGASYFIDYPPQSLNVDIIPRLKAGIEMAKADGFDLVFIVEDDDFYPKTYFDSIRAHAEFFGSYHTTYYHIFNRSYQEWEHPGHSSLFTTGFRISALEKFTWDEDSQRFVDLSLWRFAIRTRKIISLRDEPAQKAIGIKHGLGMFAGRGHVQRNKFRDLDLSWLKANVDIDAFTFYSSLKQ